MLVESLKILVMGFQKWSTEHFSRMLPGGAVLGENTFADEGMESVTARAHTPVWNSVNMALAVLWCENDTPSKFEESMASMLSGSRVV